MKLAFILFRYYPYGGLERDFIRIALACQARGHQIAVYTMKWEGDVPAGFSVHLISANGITNHARCASFAKGVAQSIAATPCDLVVGFNRIPGLDVYFAADVCYEESVRRKHGWLYRLTSRYRIYSAFEKAVFDPDKKTEILLLVDAEKKYFSKYYGTSPQQFHSVPAGISRYEYVEEERKRIRKRIRETLKLNEGSFLFLMVGSDFKRKGVERTLRALSSLAEPLRQKTFLYVIGKGNADYFASLIKKLRVSEQVCFLGARDDVIDFMLSADALVHPAHQETAGMVLIEALTTGLPVLVTENCGYAFHIRSAQAGIVIPMPFDQDVMNGCLMMMLNKFQDEIWRQNAVAYAKNTDLYSLPETAVNLIEKIAQKRRV